MALLQTLTSVDTGVHVTERIAGTGAMQLSDFVIQLHFGSQRNRANLHAFLPAYSPSAIGDVHPC